MFCRECGNEMVNTIMVCPKCGVPTGASVQINNPEEDVLLRISIPIGRSPYAIIAGYLGLFSLFPFLNFIAGPLAVIFGFLAISDIKKSGNRKLGMGRAIFGIVLGIIGTLGSILIIIAIIVNK